MKWLFLFLLACSMPEKVTVRAVGLCSAVNSMTTPEGALAQADNVTIGRDNVIETRRGMDPIVAKALSRIFGFKNCLVGHGGTTLARSADGITWTDYPGTLTPLADAPVRVAEASSDLFLTAADGVKRLDAYAGTPEPAGAPAAIDLFSASTAVGTAIPVNSGAAYRVVFGKKDANGRLILGAPSGRVLVATTGSTAAGSLVISPPPNVNASHFVQIYRSPTKLTAEGPPSDDLQLAYESAWPFVSTRGATIQRAAGTVTITTAAAHGLALNDYAYIAPGNLGFASGLYPCIAGTTGTTIKYLEAGADAGPFATTAAIERITYAVTDNMPDALLQAKLYTNAAQEGILQSNDPPPVSRDLATFRGMVFFADIQRPASQIVTLVAAGAGGFTDGDTITVNGITSTVPVGTAAAVAGYTPQQRVAYIAPLIARNFNISRPWTVTASYVSGPDDPAGKILFSTVGTGDLVISTSRPSVWQPSSLGAKAERMQNGIGWTKKDQPDSAPRANTQRIGSADKKNLRVIPTRDSVFLLKEDDGVFRITGSTPETISIDPFDYNTHLVAPETARALDNKIFMLTEQGVVALTDTGVSLISRTQDGRGIEDILRPLLVDGMKAVTERLAFAVTSESDRKYVLFLPTLSSDTVCTQAFAYDLITQAWTRAFPDASAAHAVVGPDDRFYLVDGVSVYRERKTFTDADFTDDGAQIVEVVEWMPQFAQPGMLHEFTSVVLSLRRPAFTNAEIAFATDLDPVWEAVALEPVTARDYATVHVLVPRDKARGSLLRIRWTKNAATRPTQIQALTVYYVPGDSLVATP